MKKEIFVLYDSNCGFCKNTVIYLKGRDKKRSINWIPRNSDLASKLSKKLSINSEEDSIILIENEIYLLRSDAIIYIFKKLNYKFSAIFHLIPRNFRDYIYNLVAKNRYFFGKCDFKNQV